MREKVSKSVEGRREEVAHKSEVLMIAEFVQVISTCMY